MTPAERITAVSEAARFLAAALGALEGANDGETLAPETSYRVEDVRSRAAAAHKKAAELVAHLKAQGEHRP